MPKQQSITTLILVIKFPKIKLIGKKPNTKFINVAEFLFKKEFSINIVKIITSTILMSFILIFTIDRIYILGPIISLILLIIIGLCVYFAGLFLMGVYKKSDITSLGF